MPDRHGSRSPADDDEDLEEEVRDMNIKEESPCSDTLEVVLPGQRGDNDSDVASAAEGDTPHKTKMEASRSVSRSPVKHQANGSSTPNLKAEAETVVGGEIMVKAEPGKPLKLSRSTSHKVPARVAPLFDHLPDSTAEATSVFEVIEDCIYANKYMGLTEHALECDCAEEWDPTTKMNYACGDNSDCINRATKMECIGDCGCGINCQNQRFQNRQYADVTVIKTEKKGYGLRVNTDLKPHDFIFEYVGEVIGEAAFRRRMHQYDEEGIKHFYFMSLTKGEFVDATKKGNLGRFCNHSCNPNCYVDKWVVGERLRMGIFAERKIKAGEELVFNYNVDRYGADPQPCYCGEPNCTGFIGGKTQTDRATKLSNATIEALGIEDADDWDTAVAKRPKKRKTAEDDEEYVNNVQPKALDEGGVTKVMATLMQCKEKWIAVKLLNRLQRADEDRVRNRVVRMHGYRILNTTLATWIEDDNVVLQIFDILNKLPRLTRNKIQDSKIEDTVKKLADESTNDAVKAQAGTTLDSWAKLEVGYRIPRVKRDPAVVAAERRAERERIERRARSRSRSRSKSLDAPKGPSAPTGPRALAGGSRYQGGGPPRPPFRRPPINRLPEGWHSAMSNGRVYYYNDQGETTWDRPTAPANNVPPPPPPPPRIKSETQKLQDVINSIIADTASTPQKTPTSTPAALTGSTPRKDKEKEEKWRSYSDEKRRKLYENTLFPHISHVLNKYKKILAKDDLKRFGKEIGKKLVASDFKHGRVTDPTAITEKQEKQVKRYTKEFLDKAVQKKKDHDKKRAERKAHDAAKSSSSQTRPDPAKSTPMALDTPTPTAPTPAKPTDDEDDGSDIELAPSRDVSDGEDEANISETPATTPSDLKGKRKRESHEGGHGGGSDDGTPGLESTGVPGTPAKKVRGHEHADAEEEGVNGHAAAAPPPPPPPPPPPAPDGGAPDTETLDHDAADAEDDQGDATMRDSQAPSVMV